MTATIYTLSDPRTGAIRYVGKTSNPDKRYFEHLCDRATNRKANWVRSLRKAGCRPTFETLEAVPDPDDSKWPELERFWISYLRFLGFDLTNLDSGGNAGFRRSDESNRKTSIAKMGHPVSEETREKLRRAHTGRRHSPQTLQKMSLARKGRKMPLSAVLKSAAARRGQKRSPEVGAKIAAKLRGRTRIFTPEHRANLSAALQGIKKRPMSAIGKLNISMALRGKKKKPRSPEHRAKLSENWARKRESVAEFQRFL